MTKYNQRSPIRFGDGLRTFLEEYREGRVPTYRPDAPQKIASICALLWARSIFSVDGALIEEVTRENRQVRVKIQEHDKIEAEIVEYNFRTDIAARRAFREVSKVQKKQRELCGIYPCFISSANLDALERDMNGGSAQILHLRVTTP